MAQVDVTPTPSQPSEPGSVPVSDERFAKLPSGVQICYQTIGDPGDRPLLLVMGLAGPMTWWPMSLCRRLAERGFYVIRYDNRDAGRSTQLSEHRVTQADLVRAFFRQRVRVPYSLEDLADDGLGILDDLGLDAAHVAGISMGGMIGQIMAIAHPDRVLSLTSVMSSTGRRRSGYQDPLLLPQLFKRADATRERYVASSVAFWRLISSPGYRGTDEEARLRAEETYDRGVSIHGIMRQMLAVITQRDRTPELGRVRIPVTVVHGLQDRMVHVSGGRATAAAVPGAELQLVPGMGHDIPEGLVDTFADAISRTADRAR